MSRSADEIPCRAITSVDETADNILFTPPCDCPRCTASPVYERGDHGWLRIAGHEQRYRVEVIELGAVGRAVLGGGS